jgi:hypothetical protein
MSETGTIRARLADASIEEEARMTVKVEQRGKARSRTHQDRIEYRLIFGAAFLVFLVAAAVSRLLPARGRSGQAVNGRRASVFESARMAAGSTIPFAFMG